MSVGLILVLSKSRPIDVLIEELNYLTPQTRILSL